MPEALILPGMADAEPDLSTFENKTGLAEDMKFLASMPELCDVTFLVGDTREPVCAVKAVLASRSRVFAKMLYAAPSPQRKRETTTKENKLRLFLKRSSEPLLNLQNAAQQRTGFTQQLAPIPEPSGQQHQTLIIEEFEPDVFRQLIEYIHTGCVTLQPRTLLGVMNAADYYGLEELRRACAGFVQCCINVDTVCALLASAERYIQYKCTKTLVQKVLEFVDEHGNEVLNLGSFTLLPQHVVRLILAREELRADEFTKFQAALMWSKKYFDNNPNIDIKEILGTFLEYIQFHKIPANVLMREIHPLNLVPYAIIMNALAYQADPESIDPGKLSPNSSRPHRHRHHHQSLPKIRKAKSQSFRTRRSPSERRSPNAPTLTLNTNAASSEKKRSPLTPKSPVMPQPESKSPGSSSQKTPTTLSRQGTLRASSRRKNSGQLSISLSAQSQGRRSPAGLNDRSPQGRRSPLFPSSGLRSPNEQPSPTARSPTGDSQRRSPTFSIQIHTQERRSPLGAVAPSDFSCQAGPSNTRRSPTSTVHVQDMATEPEETGFIGLKRNSISLFTPIYFASEKRSPMGPIPPITVSNPAETYKSAEREREAAEAAAREKEKEAAQAQPQPEKKSVMREILAFVRKPSKHLTTRTNRFANAFTRAESGSSSGPLIRQSTFSASPAASSTAAKSAVQKQMSEVGFEPKMSLKFAHYTKMSLKLRRLARREEEEKQQQQQHQPQQQQQQQQKSSAVSSASGSKRASTDSNAGNVQDQVGASGAEEELPFELANVHFEKVGESYIKHERLRELVEPELEAEDEPEEGEPEQPDAAMAQFVEEVTNSLKVVALNGENGAPAVHHFTRRSESREPIEPRISEERESDSNDLIIPDDLRAELTEILKAYAPEPVYVNLQALRREIEEAEAVARAVAEAAAAVAEAAAAAAAAAPSAPEKLPLQCPTIEFEPPSRRSSFDPPRSPFLEQLRSPGVDTDTDLINLQRLDSGGDSFEMVDGDRKSSRAESSFDCPYSSRDTSFDVSISRYQSTSYEDQTSSFEIVDTDDRRRHIDLRKSSIELVDAETFQRSGSSCGRKSSLETHFDYTPSETSGMTPARSPNFPMTKKQKAEHFRQLHISPFSAFSRARSPLSQQTSSNYSSRDSYDSSSSYPHGHEPQRSPYADPSKKHFPLTIKQREEEVKTFLCTDARCASIFEPRPSSVLTQQLSTGSMSTPSASGYTSAPRIPSALSGVTGVPASGTGVGMPMGIGVGPANASLGSCGFSSGSEFEPPSPRRAASASPKHTFTFRIVMKKVDSSPEALCPERHRSRIIDRYRRRDSRRKRIHDAGKSF
ncbi:PREDICTED: serine-enriched protein isoform X4 [Drosophila arizonae]|uniref:Serine-enriched protein isoform X4 n=1 Tax=Drosophila arizonae TaxID=7263 RepID=A0ABM1PLH6_DROAR|nr:PREDICTED: serine-enriched protein isoform X4 [Drosophila arizonae]